MGKLIDKGSAKRDDPIYSSGPMVSFKPKLKHSEEQTAQKDEQEAQKYLEAYARMMNMLDPSQLEPLLEDDFCYASQNVFEEITSKSQFMAYITGKLKTLGSMGGKAKVWAELGYLRREFPGPCVVLAQGEKDDLIAVVLATVKNAKLIRLDLCIAPSPWDAKRSGVYPGLKTFFSS